MTDSSLAGRFWLCPVCRKHVSVRIDRCVCGFDRTTAPAKVHELSLRSAGPDPASLGRSFLSAAWPFLVIAGLAGYIAYERLPQYDRSTVLASDGSTGLRPAESAGVGDRRSDPVAPVEVMPIAQPTPAHTQVVRIEVSTPAAPARALAQAPTPQAPAASGPGAEERQAAAAERQEQLQWQKETARIVGELRTTVAAYRAQLCSEQKSRIPISNTRDTRTEYVAARNAAIAHEESGRLAGALPGWVRIPWDEFPEAETAAGGTTSQFIATKWRCR